MIPFFETNIFLISMSSILNILVFVKASFVDVFVLKFYVFITRSYMVYTKKVISFIII